MMEIQAQIRTCGPAQGIPETGDELRPVKESTLDLARPLGHRHAAAREKLELRPLSVDRRLAWRGARLRDLEA